MSTPSNRWLVLASAVVSFFAVGLTFFAVPPLIPLLVESLGLSNLEIGILMGAIAVPAIVLSIPLGAAMDRWPSRATGLWGLGTMAVGSALFAIGGSYPILLTGRLLFGVGGLVMNLLLARMISEAFSGRELSLAMGVFNAVYPASMIVIYTFHEPLLSTLGWRGELTLLLAMVLLAVPLHLAATTREHPHESRQNTVPLSPPSRSLWMLALSWMFFFAAFASVFTFAPQWAGGGKAGLLTVTAITWVSLILNPLVGTAIDRTGRPHLWARIGQSLFATILLAMAAEEVAPLLAMLLVGLAASVIPTAVYSLPARLVSASRIGFAFGFITAFSNLGTVAGPALAGAVRDHTSAWPPLWILLAILALAGALLVPRPPHHPNH